MRIQLLEAEGETLDRYVDEWRTADKKRKEVIVREVLQNIGETPQERQALLNVVNGFRKSCQNFGVSDLKNPFINFLRILVKSIKLEPKHDAYISALVDLVESGTVRRDLMFKLKPSDKNDDSKRGYLIHPSLYYRNVNDFIYTVKIFETVLTPHILKSFFKNTEGITTDELWTEDGKKIKPAGSPDTANDVDTIYGVVEMWSDGGENDLDNGTKNNKTQDRRLGQRELNRIKKEKRYNNLSDIPDSEHRDGNVVYVNFIEHGSEPNLDPSNYVDTWMQYKNGKWGKYEN